MKNNLLKKGGHKALQIMQFDCEQTLSELQVKGV